VSDRFALGPFTVTGRLGEGAMGVVYDAFHTRSGTPAAVKVVKGGMDPEELEREIRAVAELHHPHIVRLLDTGRTDRGQAWVAMERASAGSISSLRGKLSFPELKQLLMQLLDALGHAHSRAIVHLDVKPGNVLRSGSQDLRPGVKLSDFGLAWPHQHSDVLFNGGTPNYMAPELIRHESHRVGPPTDLYALGALAWAMACGVGPYHDKDFNRTLDGHLKGVLPRFRPRQPMPPAFEGWLRGLLARSPKDRFDRCVIARRALEVIDERTSRTGPPGRFLAPPVAWRRPRPRPLPKLVDAGLGLHAVRLAPLVGRRPEQQRLWSALHRAWREGRPQAVLLRGESGLGASRLAMWLVSRAHAAGCVEVFWAQHAKEPTRHDGMAPALERSFRTGPLDRQRLRGRLAELVVHGRLPPDGHQLMNVLRPAEGTAPVDEEEQHRLIRRTLFVSGRGRLPLVVLDDVHWSASSCRFVQRWLASPEPGLLVLTARPRVAIPPELADQISETIDLAPLEASAEREMVQGLLALDEDLVERIVEKAEGNPLFAAQIVEDWIDRDLLEPGPAGFCLIPGAEARVPPSVGALWKRRLVRALHVDMLRTAELLAVFGKEVDRSELEHAARGLKGSLVDTMTALEGAGLLIVRPERVRFAHGLLVETLLDGLQQPEALHALCAEAIEAGGRPSDGGRVSRHRAAAVQWLQAADACIRYAAHLRGLGDPLGNALQLDRARSHLVRAGAPSEHPLFGALLVEQVTAELLQGSTERGFQAANRAAAIAEERGWRLPLIQVRHMLAATQPGGRAALLDDARTLFEDMPDSHDRVRLGRVIVDLTIRLGRMDAGREARRRLAEVYDALHQDTWARYQRFEASTGGSLEDYLAAGEEVGLRLARDGHLRTLSSVLNSMGERCRVEGLLSRADAYYRRAQEERDGLGLRTSLVRFNRGMVALQSGDLEGARELFLEARNIAEVRGPVFMLVFTKAGVAAVEVLEGRPPAFDDFEAASTAALNQQLVEADLVLLATRVSEALAETPLAARAQALRAAHQGALDAAQD